MTIPKQRKEAILSNEYAITIVGTKRKSHLKRNSGGGIVASYLISQSLAKTAPRETYALRCKCMRKETVEYEKSGA